MTTAVTTVPVSAVDTSNLLDELYALRKKMAGLLGTMATTDVVPPTITSDPLWVKRARLQRGWSQSVLIRRMRDLAAESGVQLPDRWSMTTMLSRWENGHIGIGPFYAEILRRLFDLPRAEGCLYPTDLRLIPLKGGRTNLRLAPLREGRPL
jgi:transcriptional regulator with XRE-family HTH domain